MTDREQVEALPFTKPLDTDEFHQGVNYAMELVCVFLGADPHSFSWDAATEEFEGDVLSVLGNMFEASFGEDTNPDALRALLRERDAAEALAYERAKDAMLGTAKKHHSNRLWGGLCDDRPFVCEEAVYRELEALATSPNALEEHDALVRAEERERVIAIIEGYQNMKQALLAIREQAK